MRLHADQTIVWTKACNSVLTYTYAKWICSNYSILMCVNSKQHRTMEQNFNLASSNNVWHVLYIQHFVVMQHLLEQLISVHLPSRTKGYKNCFWIWVKVSCSYYYSLMKWLVKKLYVLNIICVHVKWRCGGFFIWLSPTFLFPSFLVISWPVLGTFHSWPVLVNVFFCTTVSLRVLRIVLEIVPKQKSDELIMVHKLISCWFWCSFFCCSNQILSAPSYSNFLETPLSRKDQTWKLHDYLVYVHVLHVIIYVCYQEHIKGEGAFKIPY